MPKSTEGLKYQKKYNETVMSKALEDILNNGLSKKKASKKYGIPRSTLQFRLSQKFTKTTLGPSPILSEEEERILVNWVLESHRKGFPRRKEDLQVSVKSFLDEKPRNNPFKDNMPGDGWYRAFLKRHPILCERVPEAVTAASLKVSEADLRKWFLYIETYLKEEGYFEILQSPDRVFNADETCFLLCPKNKTVLAPKGARNVYEIDNAPAKSNLTVLFTLSAQGEVTPPFIIYPYKRLPSSVGASVPDSWGIGISSNGWMKAELFFEYVGNVFHPFLVKKGTKFPVILFVDGHSTHTSYQLSDLCSQLGIILICLYGNATRILQPADVSTFKPLKSYWKRGVLNWRREHTSEALTQEKFAPLLKVVIETYMKPEVIRNGFITTGLCPWNPDAIDYSKCLGKMDTDVNPKQVEETVIPYSRFKEVVGENLMNKLETANQITDEMSEEFWILHKLWKEYGTGSHKSLVNNDISNEPINEMITVKLDKSININHIEEDVLNIQEMPIIFVNSSSTTPQKEQISIVPTVEGNGIYMTEELLNENKPVQLQIKMSPNGELLPTDIVLTKSETLKDSSQAVNKTSEFANSLIQDYLVWPESPVRKGNRNSERMPFVLTSEQWKKQQTEKRDKKISAEKEKEERKRKRIEKKEESEKKKMIKKQKKQTKSNNENKNTTKFKCDILSKKRIENDTDDKISCRGKINIISNVQVNEAIECAKRVLFEEDQRDKMRETSHGEVRGNLIKQGLCYICVKNINSSSYGFKCSTCTRTYHKNCIEKHGLFDILVDAVFTCKSCNTNK